MTENFITCIKKYGVLATIRTRIRFYLLSARHLYLTKICHMTIGSDTMISLKAILGPENTKGVHIGDSTTVAASAYIKTIDFSNNPVNTTIGNNCFIGIASIINGGVTIGNGCVIGAGSVVLEDVPDFTMVVGNPAKPIKHNIKTGRRGALQN